MRLTIVVPDWAERLASDLTDMDRAPVTVTPGTVVGHELPDDVYFEYAFQGPDGKLHPDPAVARRASTIWYGDVTAVEGPEYRAADLATPPAGLTLGTTDRLRLESPAMGGQTRRVSVYTPAGATGIELPLVVVQDGVAFYRTGRLHEVAQALTDRGEIRPARFAFVEPVDRLVEYAFDDSYLDFMHEELLPLLTERYQPAADLVWLGASLGGLASARSALRGAARAADAADGPGSPAPLTSGTVVALSGAFKGVPEDPDPYRASRSWLVERLRDEAAPLPRRWYLDIGTLEWLLDVNRAAAAALTARGADVVLRERNVGHNWTSWRNGLPDALRFALRAS